jgi:hypothetical protein
MKANLMLLCILAACGDRTMGDERTVADDEPPPAMPPDVEAEQSSDSSASCRDGLAACEGTCVDLMTDDENCGGCGHECMDPGYFGHCEAGSCPNALYCAARSDEIDDCDDVCESLGERCVEDPSGGARGCDGGFYLYTNTTEYDGAIKDCEDHRDAYYAAAPCDVLIPWTIFVEHEVFSEAVACCCTQEPT